MKKNLLFTMALLVSANVLAQTTSDLPADRTLISAPEESIQAAIEQCEKWAKEDGIKEADLNTYLLDCVNQELDVQDYLPVEALG